MTDASAEIAAAAELIRNSVDPARQATAMVIVAAHALCQIGGCGATAEVLVGQLRKLGQTVEPPAGNA